MRCGLLLRHARPLASRSRCGAHSGSLPQRGSIHTEPGSPPSIELSPKTRPPLPRPRAPNETKDEISPRARLAFAVLGVALAAAAGYEVTRYVQKSNKQILEPTTFSPYVLSAKERVSATSSIFHLVPASRPNSIADPYVQCWNRPVWSVQTRQPQLQVARSYTPLPPPPAVPRASGLPQPRHDPTSLRLLIREEQRGEVSSYLHRLPLGAGIDLRGPRVECDLPPNVEEVVFFAGGTGIAPALQVASALRPGLRGLARLPRMRIIWASRSREDCEGGIDDTPKPPRTGWLSMLGGSNKSEHVAGKPKSAIVQELETLKSLYAGRLTVDYFVDEEQNFIDSTVIKQHLPAAREPGSLLGQKVVMVSGPEGFITHLAGPKEWKNGVETQGSLGGLLKEHLPGDWAAIKL